MTILTMIPISLAVSV